MSSLDKLLKAFESVRLASTSGVQSTGMKLKKTGPEHSASGTSNIAQSPVSVEEPKSILDQSKSMASFASSLSQQGQNFLSKKEMLLSSRDKLSLCHSVTESIISGIKSNSVDFQKLISIGIETLFVLIDDENPDVRMNADEALNRVIRCLSENHIGKIQLELFKEIKKNGSCRCLKAAINRFALLCHHIRPQKCRAYVQNLIPLLNIIAKRTEESLQETIALSFEKILPILGHFTNDNEIRNLLKAFLPNVNHYSASMRRSAVSCLVLLCQHSRKPYFFFLWLLDFVIISLLPQQEELPSHQVMGGLLLLRSLAPHFDVLCISNKTQLDYHKERTRGPELIMSYDQSIQVYEICIHYCSSSDHNVVAASLEALQSLLQNPCQHLLMALTSPEGITRSRIKGEMLPKFTSRNSSDISIATMGLEEDSLENIELSSLICHDDDLSGMSQSFRKSVAVTPDEKMSDRRSMSLESADTSQEIPTALYNEPIAPENAINFERNVLADDDSISATSIPSGCAYSDEAVDNAGVENRSSTYSEIEIGQLSDTSLLLGRRDVDEENKSRFKKKNATETVIQEEGFTLCEEKVKIQGNIGSFFDEDLPIKYLVRFICSSYLLSGHPSTFISDKMVKVSIKVLALNCIGYAVSWQPSFFAETLFIQDEVEAEGSTSDVQYIYDILRYSLHSDPQLRCSIAVVVGQFIHSSLISNGGSYMNYGSSELSLDSLLDLLYNLLHHNSTVTVRGALAGLNICLSEILHSSHCSKVMTVVGHLLKVTTNSYWLVKVDLCELLSHLNLHYLDHIEEKTLHLRINPSKEKAFQNYDKFSHEIVSSVFIPLLSDEDRRVRSAAANAISRLVPGLLSEGDTVLKSCSQFILSDLFAVASSMEEYHLDYTSKINSSVSLRLAPPPFNQVVDQETIKNVNQFSVKYLYWRNVDDNLSRLVYLLTTKLLMCNNKYTRIGILESLSQLCLDFPPTLHPKAWDCHVMPKSHISSSEAEKGCHLGLVTLLLSLAGESAIAGDLSAQQFILTICTNWLAGRAVLLLRQTSGEHIRERKQAWVFLQNPQLSHMAENLLQHILRILCVYTHLLEGVTPSTRNILVPIGPVAVLSPIKRKSQLTATGDKYKSNTSGNSSEKPDIDERDKKNKSSFRGSFAHLPEYIKLYDVLKNAFTNYKMSLDESSKDKFCDLLQHTLKGLGIILELAGMGEFGRVAEELLQYFRVTISVLPTETIFCGQQLLKCLFGSNVVALWDHVFLDSTFKNVPQSDPDINALPVLGNDRLPSMYSLVFDTPLSHLKKELESLHEGQMETLSLGQLKKRGSFLRLQAKTTDKGSLSSYIRLFEPLVIKALKLYTISSDVTMQRSVLELLIHLVQIRVNYCLLDSEQIFIGYVIKQFEYIEEGQIKNASQIIPSMFSFLVLLSYERHHSKSIIGVPKIIQLCDGLMASGQNPLSHCVQALRPLVEDLFLERSYNSLVDQKELETQREVICSMLLRLVHYHQVVQLLSLVLISTHAANKDRWRKLSRQILDVLLPLISKLQVNIESKQALASLEELLGRVCPSVFRPPDPFLKALLTSPSEIETTEDVERWVGGILLLLRVLISLSSIDMILARLEHLGLCMDYIISDSEKSMSSSLHLALSPKRYCKAEMESISQSNFIDPLNVTQPSVQPQVALARFLLEVIRVSIDELRSLEFTKLQRNIFSGSFQLKTTPELLDHLIYSFLLTLIHLAENGQWSPVIDSFKDLLYSLSEIVEEISDSLIFLSRWHPSLVVRWCQLLSKIDFPILSLWTRVLLTSHKKSVGSPTSDATSLIESSFHSVCLSLEFVRRNGLLVFSDFVLRHNQEDEWLPWLVVQHIKDIVLMYDELPIKALLQGIYASSSASALLIQAFNARCNSVHKAKYGVNVISIVSDIHKAQSGALVIFLIDRMLATAYLMIGRLAAALCTQRLQLMLAEKDDSLLYLSGNDLKKLISKMKEQKLDKRYGQVYSLLHQVANAQQLEGFSMTSTDACSFTSPSNTLLNLSWYLQLVRNRCRSGEGGFQECSELLSCLDYEDALLVMSSKHFNLSLLPNAFRHSLMEILMSNRNWIDTSCSAEAEDSSDCSSVNEEGSECPLLTACKMVLRQHLAKVIAIVPYPHAIFVPNSSNKYSSKLCKAFLNNEAVVKLIEVLSPSVTEMMTSLTSLPWPVKFDNEILEILSSFAVLNTELLHFLAYKKLLSVSVMSSCLKSVDLLLQNQEVFALICSEEKKSYVQSLVSSLYYITIYWIKPKEFPSLPPNIRETLKGDSDSLQETCIKLMELIQWIETEGLRNIPTCISLPIRGLLIALGRSPYLNSIVRSPPELWILGWSPTLTTDSHSVILSPVPADLLHESEVLKQFIFRLNLLGFIGRQQFEETWMQFLSVLNITLNADTPVEEVPYINLSISLAVRGVTSLLVQTMLLPSPGNPHNSTLLSVAKDKPPNYLTTIRGQKLQNMMRLLHLKLRDVQHITKGGARRPLYSLHPGQVSVDYLVAAITAISDSQGEVDVLASYEFEMRKRQLESVGLDVESCIHFLHYLYSSWLSPPNSRNCDQVIMADKRKSGDKTPKKIELLEKHSYVPTPPPPPVEVTVNFEDFPPKEGCRHRNCNNPIENWDGHDLCLLHRGCISRSSLSFRPNQCVICNEGTKTQMENMIKIVGDWRIMNGREVGDVSVPLPKRNFATPFILIKDVPDPHKRAREYSECYSSDEELPPVTPPPKRKRVEERKIPTVNSHQTTKETISTSELDQYNLSSILHLLKNKIETIQTPTHSPKPIYEEEEEEDFYEEEEEWDEDEEYCPQPIQAPQPTRKVTQCTQGAARYPTYEEEQYDNDLVADDSICGEDDNAYFIQQAALLEEQGMENEPEQPGFTYQRLIPTVATTINFTKAWKGAEAIRNVHAPLTCKIPPTTTGITAKLTMNVSKDSLHIVKTGLNRSKNVLCSSVIAEVVKSLSILCDLFTSVSHHRWILETLVPLHVSHPVEDFITFQYIIIATCKALATLKSAQEEVSISLSEGILHIVENGLRSIQVSVRTCSLYGILYLLQAPLEESSPIISLAANYILKCKDGKSPECEGHEVALWEMWVYLVEHYKILTHPTLPSTALHMALSTAASSTTSPRILHIVLRGVERLILVQQITSGTIEVILKLVMDLILNCSPAVSLPALPLFVTALHCSIMIQDGSNPLQNKPSIEQTSKYPEDNSSDPEIILQFMEKLSILFDRIRVGYPFEAEVIAGLLGPCLLDMLPASQILNKVITEYISSHQPHPHLLASTLFQVFEAAMNEGGQTLVQEWVLLSLSNFTQRTPVSLAIWCLTCFFIAASNNRWLRSAFPSVQARLGKMEATDIQIFCLAAIYFRRSLDTEQQRIKFDDAFQSAATSQGFPFDKFLNFLKEEKKK